MYPLTLLHGHLALLATADPLLAALVDACFELAWHADVMKHEALFVQTLPYLVAMALTTSSSAKMVLYCLFALRDALPLLNYDNSQSISDFKMLLLC
jgi:condensin-2 complex subunit G2